MASSWWAGLAGIGLFGLAVELGLDLGGLPLGAYRVVIYPLFALLLAMLAGLSYYLLYLYTGRKKAWRVAGIFYAVLLLAIVWLIESHGPYMGVETDSQAADYGERGLQLTDEPPAWAGALLGIGLVGPALAAAIAYALLWFRTDDRTARYRVLMVSAGFVLWFGFSVVGTLGRLASGAETASPTSQVVSQLLGLLAAALTLLAYHPPKSWRERWGLRAIELRATSSESFDPFQRPRVQSH